MLSLTRTHARPHATLPRSHAVLFASTAAAGWAAYQSPAASPLWAPKAISLPAVDAAPAKPSKKRFYQRREVTLGLLAAWFLACLVLKKGD
jgi:hypothetical protein